MMKKMEALEKDDERKSMTDKVTEKATRKAKRRAEEKEDLV
jgi:hypothetical protein